MLARTAEPSVALPEASRIDHRYSADLPGYTIYGIDLDHLTRPAVDIPTADFTDSITVRTHLSLQGDGMLRIRMTTAQPLDTQVLCRVLIDGKLLSEVSTAVSGRSVSVAVPVDRSRLKPGDRSIELRFRTLQPGKTVAGKLDSVELDIEPAFEP